MQYSIPFFPLNKHLISAVDLSHLSICSTTFSSRKFLPGDFGHLSMIEEETYELEERRKMVMIMIALLPNITIFIQNVILQLAMACEAFHPRKRLYTWVFLISCVPVKSLSLTSFRGLLRLPGAKVCVGTYLFYEHAFRYFWTEINRSTFVTPVRCSNHWGTTTPGPSCSNQG